MEKWDSIANSFIDRYCNYTFFLLSEVSAIECQYSDVVLRDNLSDDLVLGVAKRYEKTSLADFLSAFDQASPKARPECRFTKEID